MKVAIATLLVVVVLLVGYIGNLKGWWKGDQIQQVIQIEKPINPLGTYLLKGKGLYKLFRFEGESTVTVIDNLIGITFPTSYILDGEAIRVHTDQSDLLLRFKGDTLVGEGYAKGIYIKQEESPSVKN